MKLEGTRLWMKWRCQGCNSVTTWSSDVNYAPLLDEASEEPAGGKRSPQCSLLMTAGALQTGITHNKLAKFVALITGGAIDDSKRHAANVREVRTRCVWYHDWLTRVS